MGRSFGFNANDTPEKRQIAINRFNKYVQAVRGGDKPK